MDTQQSVVIAVDAMGGDHAPDSVIAGVKSAEKQYSDVHFLIFGDEEKVKKLEELIDFLLPLYIEAGKLALTVAIGCTGGRHRSVAIASALNDYLTAKGVNSVNINRDVDK